MFEEPVTEQRHSKELQEKDAEIKDMKERRDSFEFVAIRQEAEIAKLGAKLCKKHALIMEKDAEIEKLKADVAELVRTLEVVMDYPDLDECADAVSLISSHKTPPIKEG